MSGKVREFDRDWRVATLLSVAQSEHKLMYVFRWYAAAW